MAVDGISVFVPAYNEVGNLETTVTNVLAAGRVAREREIIVIDDGSTDGTGALADRLAATIPGVVVVHHAGNRGLAAGYRSAVAVARLPYFAMVSGDAEDTPDSIERLFAAVGSADIVIPYILNPRDRGWHRCLVTWASATLMNVLFGFRLQHYSGQTIYPTALARSLQTTTEGSFFLAEMLVRALRGGHSFVKVGIRHQARSYGRSRAFAVRNIARAVATVARLWWELRIRRR